MGFLGARYSESFADPYDPTSTTPELQTRTHKKPGRWRRAELEGDCETVNRERGLCPPLRIWGQLTKRKNRTLNRLERP
jgi:hypothetical protein